MKRINKIIISGLAVGILFTACTKQDFNAGIENNEASTVKIEGGESEFIPYFFDADPGDVTLDVLDVRRDAINVTEGSKSNVVLIKADQALLDQYNADNGTEFEFFTDYTVVDGSIPFDGTNWTASFGPGEFAKLFTIKFDPSTLDLTKQYAMAFTITDGGGLAISNSAGHLIVQISVKNKYDGVYEVDGTMTDAVAPNLIGYLPMNYYLVTVGPSSNAGFDPDVWGDYFIPIVNTDDNSLSGYGSFAPVFTFDADGKITSVVNIYGQPAGNTRSAALDPTGLNQYNEADKTIDVKFFMKQPSAVPAAPNIRVSFDWHMKYTGPR